MVAPDNLKDPEKIMLAALKSGERIIKAFRAEHGREPTDAEIRVAISQYIEYNRSK